MKFHTLLRQLLAGVLLITLAIATFGPSLHELFEEHRHFRCNATSEHHWHADVAECDLCTYLSSLHTFSESDVILQSPPEPYCTFLATTFQLTHSPSFALPGLRAPPDS